MVANLEPEARRRSYRRGRSYVGDDGRWAAGAILPGHRHMVREVVRGRGHFDLAGGVQRYTLESSVIQSFLARVGFLLYHEVVLQRLPGCRSPCPAY